MAVVAAMVLLLVMGMTAMAVMDVMVAAVMVAGGVMVAVVMVAVVMVGNVAMVAMAVVAVVAVVPQVMRRRRLRRPHLLGLKSHRLRPRRRVRVGFPHVASGNGGGGSLRATCNCKQEEAGPLGRFGFLFCAAVFSWPFTWHSLARRAMLPPQRAKS